jgi:hypothetical protein
MVILQSSEMDRRKTQALGNPADPDAKHETTTALVELEFTFGE